MVAISTVVSYLGVSRRLKKEIDEVGVAHLTNLFVIITNPGQHREDSVSTELLVTCD